MSYITVDTGRDIVSGKTQAEVDQKIAKLEKKGRVSEVTVVKGDYNPQQSLKEGDAVSLDVTQDGETNVYKGQVVGDKVLAVRTISDKEQQQRKSNQSQYFISSGGATIPVSKALYNKVQKDNAVALSSPQRKSIPITTLTSKGVAYTETGRLYSTEQTAMLKENAFNFVSPAEKFIGERFGSKEKVYKNIVKTKLKLAKDIDYNKQQAQRYYAVDYYGKQYGEGNWLKAAPYRAKQLTAEFKSGAFNVITSPIETAATLLVTRSIKPNLSSPFIATGGAAAVGIPLSYGAMRNPKDPAAGLARTAGEASVLVGLSVADKLVTTKIKKISLNRNLKAVGQAGATRSYTTSQGETISKTKATSRVIGKNKDYIVKSTINQKIDPKQGNIRIGKAEGNLKIYNTKTQKLISTAKLDVRSLYNIKQKKSLSAVKMTQNDKLSTFVDYSRYKTLKNGFQSELGILYKTKSLKVSSVYAAKPIQVSKTVSQEIFKRGVYLESGSLTGTESRTIFVKGGIQRTAGVGKFFKIDFVKQARANPITTTSNTGTVSASTKTVSAPKTTLNLQQSLAKEAVVKQLTNTKINIMPVAITGKNTNSPKTKLTEPQQQKPQIKTFTIETSKITPKERKKPFIDIISIQDVSTISKGKIKRGQKLNPMQDINTDSISKQTVIPMLAITTVQEQKYINREPTPTTFDFPTTTTITTPITPTLFGFGGGGFGLPFNEFGGVGSPSKKLKFKSKYTPSLEAGLFNVKGKASRFAEISGLGIRKITPTGGI